MARELKSRQRLMTTGNVDEGGQATRLRMKAGETVDGRLDKLRQEQA